ncbi:MAG: BTAD domain-containing putative transcriptional regulator [Hespellia sp.]|nr:BTAD domain-containing putative transcriptional regulator [Hespellia sp.]
MKEKKDILRVHFLGNFTISYGKTPLSFGKNNTTKAMRLLQMLLYYGAGGVARERLIESLYGRAEYADVSNSLRVAAYRLKKILEDAGLPPYDYIRIKKGVYYWDSPMETQTDIREFKVLISQAEEENDLKKKSGLLREAIHLYQGDFLAGLTGEDWVLLEGVRYKNQYTEILKEACGILMADGQYEETLRLCTPASQMYPFDEWQAVKIDCYIALKKYKEAMKEYEDTAKLFFEELGITPSEKMLEQFQSMSRNMNHRPQEIKGIKSTLKEGEEESGAYYCNLPSFRDNYRLLSRLIERNGQSAFLMLCSLTNGKGQPIQKKEKLELLAGELNNTIKHCLRRGDSYTKYSESQFLALLTGTDKESCRIIYDRIRRYFSKEHKVWSQYLEFYVTSIADVDTEKSRIQFDENDTIW